MRAKRPRRSLRLDHTSPVFDHKSVVPSISGRCWLRWQRTRPGFGSGRSCRGHVSTPLRAREAASPSTTFSAGGRSSVSALAGGRASIVGTAFPPVTRHSDVDARGSSRSFIVRGRKTRSTSRGSTTGSRPALHSPSRSRSLIRRSRSPGAVFQDRSRGCAFRRRDNALPAPPDECREIRRRLDEAWEREGRDPATLTFSVMVRGTGVADRAEADEASAACSRAPWR